MYMDHCIVWTEPRSVLEASRVERGLVNPDEPGLVCHKRPEEADKDLPVHNHIRPVGLDHAQVWFAEPVVQILLEDLLDGERAQRFLVRVLLEHTLLDRLCSLRVSSQVKQGISDQINPGLVQMHALAQSLYHAVSSILGLVDVPLGESGHRPCSDLEHLSDLCISGVLIELHVSDF